MTGEQAVVFTVLAGTLALLIWGRWRYDLVAVAALVVAVVLGAVPADMAFSGFGHPAVIIVALVLVISRALTQAGVVELVSRTFIRPGRPLVWHVTSIGAIGAILSTFMNNVAALAMLLPVDMQAAARAKRAPGLTLMPLAFATMLGGLITLIGTPPNIIIAQYRLSATGTAFKMFDFAPVGLACAAAGIAFITTVGWRLIPQGRFRHDDPREADKLRGYIIEVVAAEDSKAVGRPVHDLAAVAEEAGVAILGLIRDGRRLAGDAAGETIRAGDTLVVEGSPDEARQFAGELKLTYSTLSQHAGPLGQTAHLAEAVVAPRARIEGRSADEVQLLSHYGVQLVGVSRQGRRFRRRVRHLPIRAGDVLLLIGEEERLADIIERLGCLPLRRGRADVVQRDKLWLGLAVFAGAIALSTLGLVNLPVALAGCVALYAGLRVITLSQAYEAVDWPVIVLLASLIPIGEALERTGGTALIGGMIVDATAGLPAFGILGLLMVVTMALSAVLNNVATSIVVAPVAIAMSARLGISPDFLLMGVAVAASCAFLTPIGHQNGMIVMGPGRYRFVDYWRLGLPLSLVVLAVAIPLISLVWPASG
ncbi:MAG: SLC13 family permease [Hyphomicrobiales bacterium]